MLGIAPNNRRLPNGLSEPDGDRLTGSFVVIQDEATDRIDDEGVVFDLKPLPEQFQRRFLRP